MTSDLFAGVCTHSIQVVIGSRTVVVMAVSDHVKYIL